MTDAKKIAKSLAPYEGIGPWRGVLRLVAFAGGTVASVRWFGVVGLLAIPLLILAVWGIESLAAAVVGRHRR